LFHQREDFVKRAARGDKCFSCLCRSFEISRQTGYKWLSRYRTARLSGQNGTAIALIHPVYGRASQLVRWAAIDGIRAHNGRNIT
jgi:transposase-like protein